VQSTLIREMSFSFNVVAASSYSGARALQWPHQGAKTVFRTKCQRLPQIMIVGELDTHTLGKDQRVLWGLHELIERVLLELDDIGCRDSRRRSEQAESQSLGVHIGYL
jgi:hypothetical protein